jgi:putative oxidoreductase
MSIQTSPAAGRTNWLNIALWVAQALLAAAYLAAGWMKVSQPIDSLVAMGMGWATAWPAWSVQLIGVAEIAGALGLILPAATRIIPFLTPLAALGLSIIQVLAIIVHATRGETAMTLPANLVLLALSLFILWGRMIRLPIAPRG